MVEGAADNRKYAPWWDVLRLVAALDIVGHHVGSGYVFGGVGLPIFLIAGTALGVSRTPLKPLPVFVKARVRRILLPWLFWSVVIAVGMVTENLLQGESPLRRFKWEMLLYGPQIHLWFLPFIVGAGVLTFLAFRWVTEPGRTRAYRMAIFVALTGLLVLIVIPGSSWVGWPLQQWIFGAVVVPMGVVMGEAFRRGERGYSRDVPARGVIAVLLLIWLGSQSEWWGEGTGAVAGRYWVAFLILWLALTFRRPAPFRWASALSKPMMGVYILHPAVFQWLVRPSWVALMDTPPPSLDIWAGSFIGLELTEGALTVLVTFGISLGLVVALQHTPLRRFL